ncbi:hypothetical protein Pint_23932 [Pistacia integerrima]|uniref:Uncharacterized protein n=1 Tax=Pistacia integerrima TaxID=434235 RepID=A0ACC0YKE4_9ROSI|nr:hypothetical protein Pint_23932 [Pistacia integerrima]
MSEEKVVCVTGASGYIVSWLVKLFLERGYSVKTTVRDPELIDPAVKGTLNVLNSCAKVQSVKRVTVLSSLTSIIHNGTPLNPDVVVDEAWFSNPALCKESKSWYALSKTLAEEAACKFAKENGTDLVTFHPGVVIVPFVQPTLNLSVEGILMAISGNNQQPFRIELKHSLVLINLLMLEMLHMHLFKLLRFPRLLEDFGSVTDRAEILKMLHKHYPTLPLSEEEDKNEKTQQFSKERARSLGINFMPWEVSLRDTMETLKEKGFIDL